MKQLRKYQHDIVRYIVHNPRCGVFVPMGMGKTIATLTAIDFLKTMGEIKRKVLVLAPLRVAQSTWPDEVREWPQLNLTIASITGTAAQRIKALKTKADVYTINYENLPWLEEQLDGRWPFDMIVADESTKLKGFRTRQGTKRARVLAKYAHKTPRFVQLTGTPAPNGVKDLWALGWFIDEGSRLGRNYSAFLNRWFRRDFSGFSWEPMPHSQQEIEKRIEDVCYSLDVRGHFDIADPIENVIKVNLPEKARSEYTKLERQMFTELEDALNGEKHTIEALNAAGKTMKCLQLANGAAYVEGDNKKWIEVHDAKIKALESIIEEASGMPVLVAYHFKSDLARLKKAFPSGKHLDKNPKTVKAWNSGQIPIMFVHPASAGHGLSLQHGGNILVFFSLNWNLEEHQQIIERIGPVRQKQAGYDRPVFIHYIMARNTVDTIIKQRLETKGKVQDLLLKAMKEKV